MPLLCPSSPHPEEISSLVPLVFLIIFFKSVKIKIMGLLKSYILPWELEKYILKAVLRGTEI